MFATTAAALAGVERLVAVAVLLQTIELWQVRRSAADDGVWRWQLVRRDLEVFPRALRWLLDVPLRYRGFLAVLVARMLAAVAVLFVPHLGFVLVLLASTVLIALRWRGSFNGGSDFMTLVVLTALCVATAFPAHPLAGHACLWYIALQSCNSYFVAGLVKLRRPSWRSGEALAGFLRATIHGASPLAGVLARHRWLARGAAWTVIVFECTFPLALLGPVVCLVYVALALGFHVANARVFGLNRFLFAWSATYPALYYCSQRH